MNDKLWALFMQVRMSYKAHRHIPLYTETLQENVTENHLSREKNKPRQLQKTFTLCVYDHHMSKSVPMLISNIPFVLIKVNQ